jgi:hypothetical protein
MKAHALSGDRPANEEAPPSSQEPGEMIEPKPKDEPRAAARSIDEVRLRQQVIGVRLRQMFDAVVNEEVPEEFLDILRRADERAPGAT